MDDRVYRHDQPLFVISLVISTLVWIGLIVGTFGAILVFALLLFVVYVFAKSGLIAYLKGTAVRIAPQQFPDLHERLVACCETLGVTPVPDAYLLNGSGLLNAFATRFLGKDFVILLSDIVEAVDSRPGAVNFYIGHELAHIARRHLVWAPVLLPASALPLLGTAYSRARETTCDLHGAACCTDPDDAALALSVLGAGRERWRTMTVSEYIRQATETGGFWMSFHELISDYPWLVKRVVRVAAHATDKPARLPARHPFAYVLAAFVPRSGGGAAGALLVLVFSVGITASIAVPSLLQARQAALRAGLGDIPGITSPAKGSGGTAIEFAGGADTEILERDVVAGGPVAANALEGGCNGYIAGEPDFILQYTGSDTFLRIALLSIDDTTLVVRTPTGQFQCADDTIGRNPGLELFSAPAGTYEIWAGSFSPVTTRAALQISSGRQSEMQPAGAQLQPPASSAPVLGPRKGASIVAIDLGPTTGFATVERDVVAGGVRSATSIDAGCNGYIADDPDFVLRLTDTASLVSISMQSSSDTTLVVQSPTGEVFCNDDTNGTNPAVNLMDPDPGTYRIWAGVYTIGTANATLTVSAPDGG